MKKEPMEPLTDAEGEVRELTAEDMAHFAPFSALPLEMQQDLLAINAIGRSRGRPRKAEPKIEVKLRIDPDVLTSFKATGKGWQTRMNQALREWIAAYNPTSA